MKNRFAYRTNDAVERKNCNSPLPAKEFMNCFSPTINIICFYITGTTDLESVILKLKDKLYNPSAAAKTDRFSLERHGCLLPSGATSSTVSMIPTTVF